MIYKENNNITGRCNFNIRSDQFTDGVESCSQWTVCEVLLVRLCKELHLVGTDTPFRCHSDPGRPSYPVWSAGAASSVTETQASSDYLGQLTLAKNGWDLMSSTPAPPAPSLSRGLNCRSCCNKDFASSDRKSGRLSDVCRLIPAG